MLANRESVKHSLMYPSGMYVGPDGEECADGDEGEKWVNGEQLMTAEKAYALIDKHDAILKKGERLGTFAYFVAAEIMRAEETK